MTDLKLIEDAWLDIDVKESELFIPTSMLSPNSNDFHLQLAYLLMQPEYIPFLAKEVLGIQLLPFQSLVLQEMWARKFPMLIASRGAGKSFILSIYSILRAILFPGRKIVIVGAAFRQSKVLFEYMETIWNNSSLLRDMFPGQDNGPRKDTDRCLLQLGDSKIICLPLGDGCLSGDTLITTDTGIRYIDTEFSSEEKAIIERKLNIYCEDSIVFSDEAYCNGLSDTVKITTGKGFVIEGTLNHKVLSKDAMVELQNLNIGDTINIDCSVKWPLSCSFVDSHEAYCLGLLVGDGNYTDKYHIGFATKDTELINSLQKSSLFNNNWKQMSDIVHYKIFGKDTVSNFLNYWEINKTYTKDKYIPNKILSADKVAMSNFISGLFDTDGHIQVSRKDGGYGIAVGFTNTSEILVKQLQYILTHYGIVAKVTKRDRNVNWNTVYELYITGKDTITFAKEIGFKLARKQDILIDAISKKKKVFSKNRIDNYYFDTVKTIEYGKAITYDMHVPETHLYSANGFVVHNTKIRGQRANDIIADEFACLASSTLIQTDCGLIKISDYLKGDVYNLLNKDRELETPERIFKTPLTDVYQVTTQNGYSFRCSDIHQVMTTNGWKLAKDLTEEDNLILSSNNYFPNNYISYKDTLLDEKLGWLLGVLVSEGTCTNRNFISIKNTDRTLIDKLKNNFNFDWKEYHKDEYSDPRGWKCKESWELCYNNTDFRTILIKFGLSMSVAHEKTIPSKILQSPRSVVVSFLSGLFEGDGSAFNYYEHNKKRVGIAYYSSSKKLLDTLQILLLKFGVTCSITVKNSNISKRKNYMLSIRGESAYKIYQLLDILKWKDKFNDVDFLVKKPQIRTVTKKTTRYYLSTTEGGKNNHLGSFDSREKAQEYFKNYSESKDFVFRVKSVKKLKKQQHLYDFYMPKTNSFIGNGFIQHNSIPRDIFETVVSGFGVVKPNTIESVKKEASKKKAKELGIVLAEDQHVEFVKDNQIIFSGTAYYDFNHFASYWKKWRAIINSNGDKSKLKEVFAGTEPPKDFNWRHYSIIRIPYELLPDGFMDASQVARSKATVHSGIYAMEFGAVFSRDSQGFFKRSLIESCVTGYDKNILDNNGEPIIFEAALMGDYGKQYVFGVDPASEVDNFSIVVIEIAPECRKIVYCWTTTRNDHIERVKRGQIKEKDFYSYCARKIRDLMKLFPCVRIAMDAQGGGIAVMEALHDSSKLSEHEQPIWPVINPDKEQPWDGERGLHILEMCQFANYEWYSEANHGMRKDFEDKVLLFPFFDTVTLGISNAEDGIKGRTYDTLEDCVMEIEELKNELSIIQMTQTPSGRDRWDTPEVIVAAGKKSKMRKDRYSALLMANMIGRIFSRIPTKEEYQFFGGFAYMPEKTKPDRNEDYYKGPAWFVDNMKDVYDIYE